MQTLSTQVAETVINGGYCIGCGACAAKLDSPFQMRMDEYGRLTATLKSSAPTPVTCPFASDAANEDEIAQKLFSAHGASRDPRLGYIIKGYAGHANGPSFRPKASSGGMCSWILNKMLTTGAIDAVIHVRPRVAIEDGNRLFAYAISSSPDELMMGAKSRYYPVELSQVIQQVLQKPGRYAFVGVPCFVKAVRQMAEHDAVLQERIKYCIGIVCGHLKSARFADMFAWQLGFPPGTIDKFDFRVKTPGYAASSYSVQAEGTVNGKRMQSKAPAHSLFGYDWGWGFLKYQACDYCDDVFAETADVTFGDAWLENYDCDWEGNNVVVVRNPDCAQMIECGMQMGELQLKALDIDALANSQAGGLRHRRQGLAYRLYVADKNGVWRPPKRVEASLGGTTPRERRKFECRTLLAHESHIAFREAALKQDFSIFKNRMEPLIAAYEKTLKNPLWKRACGYVWKKIRGK